MSTTTWPQRGASSDTTQPWQDPDSGITPRAGLPVLASGSADPAAPVIFAALARLGYDTPITRGENPVGVIGPEELAAVRAFRADYGVQEDPDAIVGTPDSVVGPWTAEAILRADEHAQAGDDAAGGDAPSSAALEQLQAQVDEQAAKVATVDELQAKVDELEGRLAKLEAGDGSQARSGGKAKP